MFQISPNDPTQLSQVGSPVNSGGNFPVSIAVSSQSNNGMYSFCYSAALVCFKLDIRVLHKINVSYLHLIFDLTDIMWEDSDMHLLIHLANEDV